MSDLLTRRHVLACGLAAPVVTSLHARTASQNWLLGIWQSDMARTIDQLRFSDSRPAPDAQTQLRMAEVFGELTYLVTDSHFTVRSTRSGTGFHEEHWRYSVKNLTETHITLQFTTFLLPAAPPLVLFRESEDVLFTDSGQHKEFFIRVRPSAQGACETRRSFPSKAMG